MKLNEVEQQAKAALMKCLEEVPFLQVKSVKKPATKGPSPDLMLKLKLQNSEQLLLAEVKSSGQPKPTREAVNQLLRQLRLFPGAYGVVVAPYISPQAVREFGQAIGWASTQAGEQPPAADLLRWRSANG